MSEGETGAPLSPKTTYPRSEHFSLGFAAYEDRLVLTAQRAQGLPATILLTRRMVLLVLQQLLSKLPDLSGLRETPRAYWQDVLQMAHQKATEKPASAGARRLQDEAISPEQPGSEPNDAAEKGLGKPSGVLYLATELVTELKRPNLVLAFKGLPVPEAMQRQCQHESIAAFVLDSTQVHQFLELLIAKSTEAQWHLPLDLPWLEPLESGTPVTSVAH